jgi:alcohol dehydrogenase class IV
MRFDLPTSWRHGRGLAAKTGDILKELGCKQSLLLTDAALVRAGVVAPVVGSLAAAGIEYTICGEVTQEPTVALVDDLAAKLDLTHCDSIVAVGGGSVIDVAKSLAALAQFGGSIGDYAGINRIPAPLTRKVIAIPTTAGTGSEVTDGSALIDEAAHTKFLVLSTLLCPTVAITDPEMTLSLPPNVTAHSGADALTHAIESYLSRDASIATEPFSLKAIALIGQGLPRVYRNGKDLDAREQVQIGATMAMIAGMNAHMGLCHALLMPICGLYHMPHGRACGMTIPYVLEFNARTCKDKAADIFKALGFLDPDSGSDAISESCYTRLRDLFTGIGITGSLRDYRYCADDMPVIVRETLASVQCCYNPIVPTGDDITRIVKRMI